MTDAILATTESPLQRPRKAHWLTWLRRVATILLVFYLFVCVGVYFVQDMLIFPGRATQGDARANVTETATTSLVKLSLADGTPVVARFDRAPASPERAPTVLLFYGNGQCAQSTGGVIFLLQQLGCNVMTPDYPGYGMSGGTTTEARILASADAAWAHLQSRTDIDTQNLHLVGWSFGGAVAIDLAARVQPRSLTAISSFTSIDDMARYRVPIVPASLILRTHMRSIDKIANVKCPILLIHGERDSIVPAEMSRKLASRATVPVRTFFPKESDHNNIFDVDMDPLVEAIARHLHATSRSSQ